MLLALQSFNEKQAAALISSLALNKIYKEKLRPLNQKHFARSSEKNAGQSELQFLNEVEMLHAQEVLMHSEASNNAQNDEDRNVVPTHKDTRCSSHGLSSDLPHIDVTHDPNDEQKRCECGLTMSVTGEEVLRQLWIVPLRFFVIFIVGSSAHV